MVKNAKRLLIMLLCTMLVMGDSAVRGFATETFQSELNEYKNDGDEIETFASEGEYIYVEENDADDLVDEEDNSVSSAENIENDNISILEEELETEETVGESKLDAYIATEYAGGSGTEKDPYRITNLAELRYFTTEAVSKYYEEKYYRLENDIYVNDDIENPQNCLGVAYGGTWSGNNHFDGGRYTIYNLYFNDENGGKSFFGYSFSEIKNLNICNVKIEGSDVNHSIFANSFFTISNCKIQGEVNVTIKGDNPSYVGGYGLYAIASGSYTRNGVGGQLENCVNEASINIDIDTNRYNTVTVAGIGSAFNIKNCINKGTINISEKAYEGIQGFSGTIYGIGHASQEMTNCNTAESCSISINSDDPHATIYGLGYGELIEDSNNYAQLEGGLAIYGIGRAYSIYRSNNYGMIRNVNRAAGVVESVSGYIQDCHNYGCIEGGKGGYDLAGVVHELKSGASMKECSNESDLYGVGATCGLCYEIKPGTTVKNSYNRGDINSSEGRACGLFLSVGESSSSKILIENCYNEGAINGKRSIGLASAVHNNTIIENCFNSGSIGTSGDSSNETACGLFEMFGSSHLKDGQDYARISGCYNIGALNALYSYGLCSSIQNGEILRCFNGGKVIGYYSAMGLVGEIGNYSGNTIKIEDCFNAGQIIANNSDAPRAAGIVGAIPCSYSDEYKMKFTIKNCYNIAPISVEFENDWGKVGRLVGHIYGFSGSTIDEYTFSGLYTKSDNRVPAVGKYGYKDLLKYNERSDYELQQQSTYEGYDFENVWFIDTNNADYPYPMLKGVGNVSLKADYESAGGSWFNITWKIKDGVLYIDGYGDMPELDQNNNGPWYEHKSDIQSIIIGENITSIEDYAFKGLSNVSDVSIKGSIQSIGYRAFDGCSKLKCINFSEGPTEIKGYAFYNCSEMAEIDLPNSLSSIGSHAFENCASLKKVTIPREVKKIKDNLFSGCSSLEKIDIPDTVDEIGEYAFKHCSKLEEITIPEGVTVLKVGLLQGCSSLQKLVIPSTIISIQDNAFSYCEKLFVIDFGGTKTQWEKVHISHYANEILKEKSVKLADGYTIGYFKYLTYKERKSEYYNFSYSDKWFFDSSYVYNHDLSRMSLKAAMAAFGVNKAVKGNNDIVSSGENIKDLMLKLGVDEEKIDINYRLSNSQNYYDNIGTAIGSKVIENDGKKATVIIVAVRGAGYQAEWGGNLRVGSSYYTDHQGFRIAALEVVKRLSDYINKNESSFEGEIKIWTMGFSRAAAVSNLFAAYLTNGAIDSVFGRNVFAFGFECPQNTVSRDADNAKYNNIVSIVNPTDLVTKVAPSGDNWEFTRYGRTFTLPTYENTSKYDPFINRNEKYLDILSYYDDRKAKLEYGELLKQYYWQEDIFNNLIDIIADVTLSRNNYSIAYETLMMDVAVSGMTSIEVDPFTYKNIVPALIDAIGTVIYGYYDNDFRNEIFKKAGITIAQVVVNKAAIGKGVEYIGDNIKNAHTPELCLAWMESISSETLTKSKGYRKSYTNCPVDIEVKDSNGTVIGKIVDDEVLDLPQEGIYVQYDTNGQKVAIVPLDSDYSIDFIASADGKMTYTVAEYDSGKRLPQKITCFHDVIIAEGDKFESPLVEALDKDVDYELIRENGQEVESTFVLEGDDIRLMSIEVSAEGAGSTTMSGAAIPGQYYSVTAVPLRSEKDFIGWFEGDELVSTDLVYRFFVERDVDLTARFESIDGQLWIANVDDSGYDYTGTAVKPDFKVYDGNTLLIEKVDYTVSLKNNVKAYVYGESDEEFNSKLAPSITITGKGNYADKETVYYKINPIDISDKALAEEVVIKSNGKGQKPKPVITWNDKALPATGYTYQYFRADENGMPVGEAIASVKEEGKYVIVITGQGNFEGTKEVGLTVLGDQKLASKLTISSIKAQMYTGDIIEPTVTVKDGKTPLTEGNDYTVSYQNNVAVGTATVIVTGMGDYVGTKKATFKITGTPITKATVEGIIPSVTYTGNDITFNDIKLYIKATKTTGQIDLEEGIDYIVSYQKNRSVGTATVVFTGINGYTGTLKKTFKIAQIKQTNEPERIVVELDSDSVVYSKGGAKPAVTVKFTNGDGTESILAEKTDYTLAYSKNTAVNDCSNVANMPTVKVTLKGNWSGSITKNFKIIPKGISLTKAKATDKVYQNKKNIYATTLVLTDTDGKNLAAGKDYDKTFVYKYVRDTEVLCDGNQVVRGANEPVSVNDIIPAETVIRVTASAKAGSNYTGSVSTTYRIAKSSIGSAKVTIPKQIYTGREVYVDGSEMEVKIGKTTLEYGTDFEIVPGSFENNIKKGNASVVIRGIGNYGASKKVTYVIKAKGIQWWWKKLFALSSKKMSLISADSGTGIISVRDEIKIKEGDLEKVQFIVWTTLGGKDDLRSEITDDFQLSSDGVATVDYSFNASEHRNESGEYNVKAIAIGKNGDKIDAGEIKVNATINGEIIPENPTPTITPTPTVTPDNPTPTIAPGEPTPTDTPSPTPSENEPTATPTSDVSSGFRFTYSVNADGQTATITGYEGTASGDLIIPSSIDGYSVTAIGKNAFGFCEFDGRLSIPYGVTKIGDYAFAYSSGLKGDLIIPDSVTAMGESVFILCIGFNGKLKISNNMNSIPDGAFIYCSGLTGELNIPSSIKSIGEGAFAGCNGLSGNLVIGENVTSVGAGAFSDCFGLSDTLSIYGGLDGIGEEAFDGCDKIKYINNYTDIELVLNEDEYWYDAETKIRINSLGKGKAVRGDIDGI